MQSVQSNILPDQDVFSLFLILNVKSQPLRVLNRMTELPSLTQKYSDKHSHTFRSNVAFSSDFWDRAPIPFPKPKGLKPFKEIRVEDRVAPATNGDVFIHINSGRLDLNYQLGAELLNPIKKFVTVSENVLGYKYMDGRDLTGFLDGTKNPGTSHARFNAAVVKSGEHEGGSFVFTQRWVHNLEKWKKVEEKKQEEIIGRTKSDSIQLLKLSPYSHVSRNVIEDEKTGLPLKIVRYSMPYGSTITGESGLFFVCYTKDLTVVDKLLQRMYGTIEDGRVVYDKLVDFSQAVTGGYWFAPSLNVLKSIQNKTKDHGDYSLQSKL